MIQLTFKTMPLGTNNLYFNRGKFRVLTPKARERKEQTAWEARAQYRGKPLEGSLAVSVALYWPTRANHDIDNIKMLLDALTGILWVDDGQITQLHLSKAYCKENPRVELSVEVVPLAS